MKKPYHIVTRAARESAAVVEQFCQTNGQILLPIVNLIQSASQVVENVIHEIGHQMLETDSDAERRADGRRAHAGQSQRRDPLPRIAGRLRPTGGPQSEGEAAAPAPQKRRRSEDSRLREAAPGSRPWPAHAGRAAARRVDAGIPGSAAADGRDGGGLAQCDQPQGDGGQRRAAQAAAGAALGERSRFW